MTRVVVPILVVTIGGALVSLWVGYNIGLTAQLLLLPVNFLAGLVVGMLGFVWSQQ